jgi:ATP-dependent helicase HepA
MVVREHALEATGHVSMLIAVPAPLVNQWREELGERFQLKQLLLMPRRPSQVCDKMRSQKAS